MPIGENSAGGGRAAAAALTRLRHNNTHVVLKEGGGWSAGCPPALVEALRARFERRAATRTRRTSPACGKAPRHQLDRGKLLPRPIGQRRANPEQSRQGAIPVQRPV